MRTAASGWSKIAWGLGFLALLAAAVLALPARSQGAEPMGNILLVYAVGGVLTTDGTLWQFHPEKGAWITVDEAFKEQGKETHVLPLPVSAGEIARMESFGFLVTRSGGCWLFDLERDRWRDLGRPPRR